MDGQCQIVKPLNLQFMRKAHTSSRPGCAPRRHFYRPAKRAAGHCCLLIRILNVSCPAGSRFPYDGNALMPSR